MRKYFFTVRNIADYRKFFSAAVESLDEETEQKIFFAYTKHLFSGDAAAFDGEISCGTGIDGLRLDFNFGLRLDVPVGNFRVRISDAETEQIFFDREISDVRLISVEKFFVPWRVEIFSGAKIFDHTLNLEGRPVTIALKIRELGDTLAFLPFVREFVRVHRCRAKIFLPEPFRKLAAKFFPELTLTDAVTLADYATYFPAMGRGVALAVQSDLRNMPMTLAAKNFFGLKTFPSQPTFTPTAPKIFSEPYVCIGVQASSNRKAWLYPRGWKIVVDYLKLLGYRVACIDRRAEETNDGYTVRLPEGVDDFTGDFDLIHRAEMLSRAEFFVGLSSGLAWLAHSVGCPVVMICGFSQDWFEFSTPYRVANRNVCNGCLNDVRVNFFGDRCPNHKGTPRELECQKKISPRQVINAIENLIVDRNLTPPVMR